jgi:O-antigen/teichoic acid export membrane protein
MMLFPITLVIFVYAQDGLMLWLGADFARHSFRVLQILTIGVIVNSLAQVPLAVVQGIGRADISAKLHMMELPFYLASM